MAHHEDLGSRVTHRLVVEVECPAIEPPRPGFLVVVEGEPNVRKPSHLCAVPAPSEIDDVGYPERAKFFGVLPGPYRATER